MIHILSAPIRSGKTTALMAWTQQQASMAGFLTPDLGMIRQLYRLDTQTFHPFQAEPPLPAVDLVSVGRFHFYASAFRQAQDWLRQALLHPPDWLVVDELGKLELKGRGFEPALGEVIRAYQTSEFAHLNLLLVVRDSLYEVALQHYQLKEVKSFSI